MINDIVFVFAGKMKSLEVGEIDIWAPHPISGRKTITNPTSNWNISTTRAGSSRLKRLSGETHTDPEF